ncbi:MAG: hypothetical protein ACTSRS_07665 [Candidatus Helarchaeota archaeon]
MKSNMDQVQPSQSILKRSLPDISVEEMADFKGVRDIVRILAKGTELSYSELKMRSRKSGSYFGCYVRLLEAKGILTCSSDRGVRGYITRYSISNSPIANQFVQRCQAIDQARAERGVSGR